MLSPEMLSQEMLSQEMLSQEMLSQEMLSQEMLSQEMLSQEMLSQEMLSHQEEVLREVLLPHLLSHQEVLPSFQKVSLPQEKVMTQYEQMLPDYKNEMAHSSFSSSSSFYLSRQTLSSVFFCPFHEKMLSLSFSVAR